MVVAATVSCGSARSVGNRWLVGSPPTEFLMRFELSPAGRNIGLSTAKAASVRLQLFDARETSSRTR